MRPYKAKRKDNNEWVYGWYWEYMGRSYIRVLTQNGQSFTDVQVNPVTTCQQIGLRDLKENEIYDKHIVKIPYIDPMGGISWDNLSSEYNRIIGYEFGRYVLIGGVESNPITEYCHKEPGEYVSNYGNTIIHKATTDLLIIGNQIDNPELIGESK